MQIFGIVAPIWLIVEMGLLASFFTLALVVIGTFWYFYYGKAKVVRDGAIYHIFARLGQRRFEGLDIELRGILKEKGLRDEDPFDVVAANAGLIDISDSVSFDEIVEQASFLLSKKVNYKAELIKKRFMEGTQVGATPVSHGAALPHLRLSAIQHSILVMVRCKSGVLISVENDLISKELSTEAIYAFFFLVSPDENPGQHLRILAQIASHVDDEKFLNEWLSAKNEQELKELLLREDRYISLQLTSDSKTAPLVGSEIRYLKLPEDTLIAIIHRKGQIIIPQGKTILEENDRLTIISNPKGIEQLYENYVD